MEKILWGDIDLTDPAFGVVEGSGVDFGGPVPVTTALARFLLDGELVAGDRSSNRTLNLLFHAKRESGAELGKLGEALAAQGRKKRSQIVWISDDPSNPTIFDTFRASVVRKVVPGDPRQLADFVLTIPAMPFVHPQARTVVQALSDGTTDESTNVDTCSATTGWSGSGAVVEDGGAIYTSASLTSSTTVLSLTRTVTLDVTATPFISFDWKLDVDAAAQGDASPVVAVAAYADGSRLALVSSTAAPTSGYQRATFQAPASGAVATSLTLQVTCTQKAHPQSPRTAKLWATSVDRTNLTPISGTTRQRFRTIPVLGSQRSPARFTITSESWALGQVLLYTRPDDGSGYVPPLRPWRVSGGTTPPDTAAVSGVSESVPAGTWFVADVPASLLPSGMYHLLAKVAVNSQNVQYTWKAQLRINSTDVGDAATGTVARAGHGSASVIEMIDAMQLPPLRLSDNSTATVRISLKADKIMIIDELWPLEVDTGAYTLVDCKTVTPVSGGASVNRLRIDPADSDAAEPTILGGYAEDWSDSHFIGHDAISSWSDHPLEPGQMVIFSVTCNAPDSVVAADYYPLYQDQVL